MGAVVGCAKGAVGGAQETDEPGRLHCLASAIPVVWRRKKESMVPRADQERTTERRSS